MRNRIASGFLSSLLVIGLSSCSGRTVMPENPDLSSVAHRDTSPKVLYPQATQWLTGVFNGREFMFCQDVRPSYGVSLIDFHGWYFDPSTQSWEHFVDVKTSGLGNAEIVFDEPKGLCLLRGKANNKFMDVDVVEINLLIAFK